jgi:hypothetical protein
MKKTTVLAGPFNGFAVLAQTRKNKRLRKSTNHR